MLLSIHHTRQYSRLVFDHHSTDGNRMKNLKIDLSYCVIVVLLNNTFFAFIKCIDCFISPSGNFTVSLDDDDERRSEEMKEYKESLSSIGNKMVQLSSLLVSCI
jgi:hypothetical protein